MNDIKTAAQALVDVAALPEIALRDGLMLSGAISDLKAALKRDKAIDELVKHDQENGLYDAPECDAGKDCPRQPTNKEI